MLYFPWCRYPALSATFCCCFSFSFRPEAVASSDEKIRVEITLNGSHVRFSFFFLKKKRSSSSLSCLLTKIPEVNGEAKTLLLCGFKVNRGWTEESSLFFLQWCLSFCWCPSSPCVCDFCLHFVQVAKSDFKIRSPGIKVDQENVSDAKRKDRQC